MTCSGFPDARDTQKRFLAITTFLAALMLRSAAAEEARPLPGFFFCVAPYSPRCVEETKSGPNEACEGEIKAYVKLVFRYRDCLTIETERAVRESNDVIDAWKCRKNKSACPIERRKP
jgi:hypothetical protein